MAQVKILEGAEEFSLGDGPVGALLVHGFSGSPQGMRGLGEYLAERGIAVTAPRLPGHGTTWEDLSTRTAQDWVGEVEDSFHRMAAERDEVFIVALSFGAALALDVAARYPDEVAGVVTLAGMVMTRDPRRHLAPVIRRLTRSIPGVGNDIADPSGKEIAYDRLPTGAAYYMLRFLKAARLGLPAVRCPVLVMHGRQDHTVHPANAELIYASVGSEDKELVWLDRSYHVITLDYDRDEVFARTYGFIKGHSNHAV
ncbi:MAG: alpha/beta fold hydrolase [Actinomycetota bacterium]|nr:alpha/beta fold hydrolase [Actinomycetota bacterium]